MIQRVQPTVDYSAFDQIIDVRSPGEFENDHIPGAVNRPVLDNEQRALIGRMFKQDSSFLARRAGASIISRNIGRMFEDHFSSKSADWRPLVYCWRGGQRSASLATILDAVGWRVSVLAGGYKGFRRQVLARLAELPPTLEWRVIQGPTGSGKTRLLTQLSGSGAQVLDLEGLACHRASVLGQLPERPQPTQRAFETLLWQQMEEFEPKQPVFVEAENRRIGRLHLPDSLWQAITGSRVFTMDVPRQSRVDFLLEDYPHFIEQPESLIARLEHLIPFQGHKRVDQWCQWIRDNQWNMLVDSLLEHHYDPLYGRNSPYPEAEKVIPMEAVNPEALARIADQCRAAASGETPNHSLRSRTG